MGQFNGGSGKIKLRTEESHEVYYRRMAKQQTTYLMNQNHIAHLEKNYQSLMEFYLR